MAVSTLALAVHTANKQLFGFPLHRYVVAAGVHTVVLKGIIAGAAFEPAWLGSAGYVPPSGVKPSTPPVVFAADIMLPRGSETSALNVLCSNAIKANVTQLVGDGLAVPFVHVKNFINNTTDYDGGTLANGYVYPVVGSLRPGTLTTAAISISGMHSRQAWASPAMHLWLRTQRPRPLAQWY
jgi:hypothetical protein